MAERFDPTQLTDLDLALASAWQTAATDLGIRVIASFQLPFEGQVFRYGAMVANFGTTNGILLRADMGPFDPAQCGAIWDLARAAGYAAANLAPLLCRYDREEFIQILNVFGWCGPLDGRPPWYTGPLPEDIP